MWETVQRKKQEERKQPRNQEVVRRQSLGKSSGVRGFQEEILGCLVNDPNLNRPAGNAPAAKRRAWGVKYAASGGMALALLLGLLANLTVMGSVQPLGTLPFSSWIARSASLRWSNRMKPTPLDTPAACWTTRARQQPKMVNERKKNKRVSPRVNAQRIQGHPSAGQPPK